MNDDSVSSQQVSEKLLASLLGIATLLVLFNFFTHLSYGIDITDGGFYIQAVKYAEFYPNVISKFGYLLKPLWLFCSDDLLCYRRSYWALALILAALVFFLFLNFLPQTPNKKNSLGFILAASFSSAMLLQGLVRRPVIPEDCVHNGHMYYLILPDSVSREQVLSDLSNDGINAVFHYVPLHDAPAGKKFGTTSGTLDITENLSARLIRLPFWIGLSGEQQEKICSSVIAAVKKQVAK
jgi:hypothetical protein